MSFALLSTFAVLLGILLLAIGLWLAQRLRVQHREVEVLSTLFWQSALEENRARVFTKRFRHWTAWLLLVAIASLLWMLLAQPQTEPLNSTQHVVLLDRSIDDPAIRKADLQLAIERASSLPAATREIVAVDGHLKTLLAAGESVEQVSLRIDETDAPSPPGMEWAIETLSSRATDEQPLSIHVVGDANIENRFLDAVGSNVSVFRVDRPDSTAGAAQLQTFGIADAASGQWNEVDVSIGFNPQQPLDANQISVSINDQPIEQSLLAIDETNFQLKSIPANGGILNISVAGVSAGSLTLPVRKPIQVSLDGDVPESLRELITLDPACQIVASAGEVRIGGGADANLRLSSDDQPAFLIESDHDDPNAALAELVDTLALKQIDAMAIAAQSDRVVDVQVASADQRSVAIWRKLFTPAFDFQESRAYPMLIARSIRWIANHPPIVPWAQQGERLPVAAPSLDRAIDSIATTSDGRQLQTTRLTSSIAESVQLPITPTANFISKFGLTTWMGLFVSLLLAGEWVLYQRGKMP